MKITESKLREIIRSVIKEVSTGAKSMGGATLRKGQASKRTSQIQRDLKTVQSKPPSPTHTADRGTWLHPFKPGDRGTPLRPMEKQPAVGWKYTLNPKAPTAQFVRDPYGQGSAKDYTKAKAPLGWVKSPSQPTTNPQIETPEYRSWNQKVADLTSQLKKSEKQDTASWEPPKQDEPDYTPPPTGGGGAAGAPGAGSGGGGKGTGKGRGKGKGKGKKGKKGKDEE